MVGLSTYLYNTWGCYTHQSVHCSYPNPVLNMSCNCLLIHSSHIPFSCSICVSLFAFCCRKWSGYQFLNCNERQAVELTEQADVIIDYAAISRKCSSYTRVRRHPIQASSHPCFSSTRAGAHVIGSQRAPLQPCPLLTIFLHILPQ